MKPSWYVVYDKETNKFSAHEYVRGRTPEQIKGKKVVIFGCWKHSNDAVDYAKAMAAEGRLKL
jgi:hypothetical protein